MNDHDLKQLWQEQDMTLAPLTLDTVKQEVQRTHRRVARRNAMEYAACVLVIAVFGFYITVFPSPLMRAGSALIILATVFIAWQLHRRASNQALPGAAGEQGWMQHQRAQLARQRDALRSAWLWYVAPLLPGTVLFRWGVEVDLAPGGPFARGWAANLAIALIFGAVALVNWLAARRLQKRLDQLDRDAR
ncbi:hypothetical protein [Roseateles puraquae]|uniref:Uncharacterized protein n=1 Tax=Roseateles puraquae TaxID=431059 RepID=A0A254N7C6_9BURK|nr:hypothetical protein [Roseateles puraquae]MDG0854252.1 hypothetical protein [Roseateles puraquae]OWR03630.1 hypothetical protein CDO81_14170 [Roseateles puraquae]